MVSSSYSSFTNYHNNLFCFKNINGPILEKSYTGNATIMDNISATYFGTLTTHSRSEGFTYSEGKAVIITEDGEMITHVSQGIGEFDN